MKITLNNVRLAFPDLWRPRAFIGEGEGQARYGATFLFAPNHPAVKTIDSAIEAVAKAKWDEKAPAVVKSLKAADKTCLHDGDGKGELDGYAGNLYISARTPIRPGVFDERRSPLTEADGRPFGGCYVNAIIDIWAQDNNYGKRINAALSGVQFVRDGEPFAGGGAATADDFGDVMGEGEEILV